MCKIIQDENVDYSSKTSEFYTHMHRLLETVEIYDENFYSMCGKFSVKNTGLENTEKMNS